VSTGVLHDLHSVIPARSRMSKVYWRCERSIPAAERVTATPRKCWRGTEVLHRKGPLECGDEPVKKSRCGCSQDDVVDVQEQKGGVRTPLKNEQGGVRLGLQVGLGIREEPNRSVRFLGCYRTSVPR
jgi:hypothetical protein